MIQKLRRNSDSLISETIKIIDGCTKLLHIYYLLFIGKCPRRRKS